MRLLAWAYQHPDAEPNNRDPAKIHDLFVCPPDAEERMRVGEQLEHNGGGHDEQYEDDLDAQARIPLRVA
jgi:hypothetical protein